MADDFRLTVDFDDEADGVDLVEWLAAFRFAAEERERLGDGVVVSRDGARVLLYTDTGEGAARVEAIVREELSRRGLPARVALERWHPVEQAWRDPAVPLPASPEEVAAERERREARETAAAAASGRAGWEVRVELPGHAETVELGERLEAEGIRALRRFRYLLVGAATEEDARALAERLRAEAPAGARVHVQPGGEMVWQVAPQNPFVILGGLGT